MPAIPLNVIARFKARAGNENDVRDVLTRMIEPTRKEDANLGYALHQGNDDPTVFMLYEGWTGKDGLQNHMEQPHFKQMDADLKAVLEAPYEVTEIHQIGGDVPE